jgi:hypothetical protein
MPEAEFVELLRTVHEHRGDALKWFEEQQLTMRKMHELVAQLMIALELQSRRVAALEGRIHVRLPLLH